MPSSNIHVSNTKTALRLCLLWLFLWSFLDSVWTPSLAEKKEKKRTKFLLFGWSNRFFLVAGISTSSFWLIRGGWSIDSNTKIKEIFYHLNGMLMQELFWQRILANVYDYNAIVNSLVPCHHEMKMNEFSFFRK